MLNLQGKKMTEWIEARKKLEIIYRNKRITKCERCGSGMMLSFHHLSKRSGGRAKHTLRATRLLCAVCHDICEYNAEENEKLKLSRKKFSI